MIRKLVSALAGLGALALSGCVTSGSTMDLVPFDQRPVKAPFESGDYCSVEGDRQDQIRSGEECARFAWDGSTHSYTITVTDDGETRTAPVSVAPFRNGVLLAQMDGAALAKFAGDEPKAKAGSDASKEDDTPPYVQSVVLVVGRAMAMINWSATSDEFDALIARHPKIKVDGKGTSRTVVAGARADILDYLWDFVELSLANEEGEPNFLIRDRLGAPDHKPGKAQQQDMKTALAKLNALRH